MSIKLKFRKFKRLVKCHSANFDSHINDFKTKKTALTGNLELVGFDFASKKVLLFD